MPKRRRHSTEFKVEAIRLLDQRGDRTVAEIVESLEVAENLLCVWKRELDPGRSNDRGVHRLDALLDAR
jgi:transposase-like protein